MKKAFVLCLALVILALSGCGSTAPAAQPTAPGQISQAPAPEPTVEPTPIPSPAPEETPISVPTEEPVETYSIDFAGLQLKYPKKWEDKVSVNIYGNKASFVYNYLTLFDLFANSDEGDLLGTVCGDEYTTISVSAYDLGNQEDDEIYVMQEDVNVILNNLMSDYEFFVGERVEKEDISTFDIETPLVTLKYPAKWEGIVSVNVTENGVSFVYYGTPLFDLVFSRCDGYLLGTYDNTPVYIVDYPVYSDEQATMQEDVNVILQYLMQDPNFIINA